MADFDVVIDKTVDQFLTDPSYVNTPFTNDDIFVSEGATLSQSPSETADYLYAVDVTLGENSTGTAVTKEGYLDLTKPGFTLFLTLGGPAPADVLSPAVVVLGTITARQDNTVAEGRSEMTVSWIIPTTSEAYSQRVGPASGTAQSFDLTFDPIEVDSETVIEVTGYAGASTTITADFTKDQNILQVASTLGFSIGDCVEVEGGGERRYYEVDDIVVGGLVLTIECNVSAGFTTGATVKSVTIFVKTKTTDYTMDYSLGILTLVAGQFTPGNDVSSIYTPILQDLDHFELYRVNGNEIVNPLAGYSRVTRDAVLAAPSVITVDDAITSVSVNYADLLDVNQNGETRTYYLFASDSSITPNYSAASAVMVETIPSVPQNPGVVLSDSRVELSWNSLGVTHDENTDGFNIYRSIGSVFDAAACLKVNSILIPLGTQYFDDSDFNTVNRRPAVEVPYPQNGSTYSYKIESEDTETEWDIGTKNEDSETGSAQLTASKTV